MSDMLPFLLTAPEATEANCCRCPPPLTAHPPTDSLHPLLTLRARTGLPSTRPRSPCASLSQLAATFSDPQLPVRLTFPVRA
ncbi:hypothetical protein VZT92_004519 [Zoarces viviparus]|uniref:Uncharacterized protein n=1 Tax=Zoarces viviparus TaxID=48416 RepID=A0AAW1FZB1_ZOAVI